MSYYHREYRGRRGRRGTTPWARPPRRRLSRLAPRRWAAVLAPRRARARPAGWTWWRAGRAPRALGRLPVPAFRGDQRRPGRGARGGGRSATSTAWVSGHRPSWRVAGRETSRWPAEPGCPPWGLGVRLNSPVLSIRQDHPGCAGPPPAGREGHGGTAVISPRFPLAVLPARLSFSPPVPDRTPARVGHRAGLAITPSSTCR